MELRFPPVPDLAAARGLGGQTSAVRGVDEQTQRPLRQPLRGRRRHRQGKVGRGDPQSRLHLVADTRRRVGQRQEQADVLGKPGQAQRPSQCRYAGTENVGTDRDELAPKRLDISGVLRPVVRKPQCFLAV